MLLNAIGQVIERPDLLDRVALIELAPIPPEKRLPEEEFWARWEKMRPRVLGAILDGVVAALAGAGEVKLEGFPRMADFARWGEAAGAAFGWPPGAFTAALESSRQDLLEGSAEAHPEIGRGPGADGDVRRVGGDGDGAARRLADTVGEKIRRQPRLAEAADTLSNRLIQHAPLLRTHGIEVTRGREAGGKRQRFLRLIKQGDAGTPGDA